MKNNLESAVTQVGFVKMMRSPEAMELLTNEPNAYRLAAFIALRCRWRDGFNTLGLAQGEALLGDHAAIGMTRKEYRVAIDKLRKWRFAATRRATVGKRRGTVARLIDSRLFDTSPLREKAEKGQSRADEGPQTKKGKKDEERQRHSNPQTAASSCFSDSSRFPATVEKLLKFGKRQACEADVCLRFLRYNNENSWQMDGFPIYSWQSALLRFREACWKSPGNNVGSVPLDWIPEIVIPDELATSQKI